MYVGMFQWMNMGLSSNGLSVEQPSNASRCVGEKVAIGSSLSYVDLGILQINCLAGVAVFRM